MDFTASEEVERACLISVFIMPQTVIGDSKAKHTDMNLFICIFIKQVDRVSIERISTMSESPREVLQSVTGVVQLIH